MRGDLSWRDHRVAYFIDAYDTRIGTGEDYRTIALSQIFNMAPLAYPKERAPAFVPSSYRSFDARRHQAQRERGRFVTLAVDIDKGDHPLDRIEALVREFAGDCAWLIYSSAHARAGDRRWRALLPLAAPVGFDRWHDCQHALFAHFEAAGVRVDRALDRAAQPVFLPNVCQSASKRNPLSACKRDPLRRAA